MELSLYSTLFFLATLRLAVSIDGQRILRAVMYPKGATYKTCTAGEVGSDIRFKKDIENFRAILDSVLIRKRVFFNIGFGFPVDQPKRLVSFSMNYQFQYSLPRNVTELKEYPEIKRSLKRRIDRTTSYDAFQTVMSRYGMEGRSCVLRTICEIAEVPIYHNGLIGELIHIIFTPGYASNAEENLDTEYHEARRLGEQGVDCRLAYPSCPHGYGLMELFSITDYDTPYVV